MAGEPRGMGVSAPPTEPEKNFQKTVNWGALCPIGISSCIFSTGATALLGGPGRLQIVELEATVSRPTTLSVPPRRVGARCKSNPGLEPAFLGHLVPCSAVHFSQESPPGTCRLSGCDMDQIKSANNTFSSSGLNLSRA